ncbi:hypothetical protein BDN71DRAFT_1445382 [Pleurotus eryngii]|uniref:Uncharacterized protein n=1 Tax=Pleurotus eryngii TaxID=5323 RepID=A0A9P5ZYS5_PLEER|nr:hypothetical protein BDN71DRAFT_1445382 [Pleurotus eryngii]
MSGEWKIAHTCSAKLRPDDSFSSTITEADNQAKGVVVDNCLIVPEIRLKQPSVRKGHSLTEYLASFRSPFLDVDVHTTNATVRIIVEQKRPPTRHPRNIYIYYRQIESLLDKATSQAEEQGACLFSMPKFARQDCVMLVGASGAWWRFCLITWPNTEKMVFDFERYGEYYNGKSGGGPKAVAGDDDNDDEGDEDDDVGEEDSKFDKPTSPNQAEVVQRAYNEEVSKNERME